MEGSDRAALGSQSVDFLIVTAVEDEYHAVRQLLPGPTQQGLDTIASIPGVEVGLAEDSCRVALIVTGQSTAVAQAAVKDAIIRCAPRAVILAGIAAGFPENGVEFGDILLPFWIFPYEHAKIRERPSPEASDRSNLEYENRGSAFDVSHPLWNAAKALKLDSTRPWLKRLYAPRPDSLKRDPAIHAERNFILGSGDKLVASEFARERKSLIDRYKKNAIGLEMEAYGSMMACRSEDVPFLLVKASQDPGTAAKDALDEKDRWRAYAAAASAAFVLTLIERYRFPANFFRPRSHQNLSKAVPQAVKEITEKPPEAPTIWTRVEIGKSGQFFEGRLYERSGLRALCVRLVGAAEEEFTRGDLHCRYTDRSYQLPSEFRAERERIIEELKREAEESKSPFYDGPCVRLEAFHAELRDSAERKHLTLDLAPIGWHDYSVGDFFVQRMLAGKTIARLGDFINLANLSHGEIRGSRLSSILCTITTMFTSDGYILVARRGTWLSVRREYFSASVDENVHREKDMIGGSLDLFNTVLRGIDEEVTPSLRPLLSPAAPRLLGIGFGLDEFHPTLLFSIFLPQSCSEVVALARSNPGKDFPEGRLLPMRVEPAWAEVERALKAQPWEEAGKASVIRAMEFVEATAASRGESCLETIQRLGRESSR